MTPTQVRAFCLALLIFTLLSPVQIIYSSNDLDKTAKKNNNFPKIESRLQKMIPMENDIVALSYREELSTRVEDIRLIIEVNEVSNENILLLNQNGATIEKTLKNLVQATIHPDSIIAISTLDIVEKVRLPMLPTPVLVSEGVSVMNSDYLQNIDFDGTGVKIAVLDGGFEGYMNLLGSELPSNLVTRSFHPNGIGAGSSHGTACAEIVHDVAPGAELYLVNFQTVLDLNQAVDWLVSQGIDIISFSMGYLYGDPGDGTGIICEIVDESTAQGVFWVTSAGNEAENHYQGQFSDTDFDYYHNFGGVDETINIYATAGETITISLTWHTNWPTTEDYDLSLYDSNMFEVDYSFNDQTIWDDPIEIINYNVSTTGTYHIVIEEYSTTQNHVIEIFSSIPLDEYIVKEGSITIPADANGAFSVGAIDYSDHNLHSYSSQGPTTDGRTKPDIAAPSGVSTETYSSFYGTSASAPHITGVAAQLLQNKNLSPQQLKNALTNTAIDLGITGTDNEYGAGRIDAYEARLFDNIQPVTIITSPNNGGWQTDIIRLDATSTDSDGDSYLVEIQTNEYTDNLDDLRWINQGVYQLTSDNWYFDWDSADTTSSTFFFAARSYDGLEWGPWDTNDVALGIDNSPPDPPTLSEDQSGTEWTSHNTPNYLWTIPSDLGSGIQYYEIKIDETITTQSSTTYQPILSDGIHSCQVRATDNVDNIGTWSNTVNVQIDTTPPTGSINIEKDELYTNSPTVTINLQSNDPGGSGVSEYTLSTDGITWDPWLPYTTSTTSNLPSEDGEKTVYAKYRDQALVESISYSDSITLDETPPNIPSLITPEQNSVIIDFTPDFSWSITEDATSGVSGYIVELDKVNTFDSGDYIQVSLQETSYTPLTDLEHGTWYWRAKAVDNADNIGEPSDSWSFSIAEPYPITVEAYCEVCQSYKTLSFSLNENHYDSTITIDGLQLTNVLTAPRTDGNPLHGFKEWKKDNVYYSNEHMTEITETGTYQMVFEEKQDSLSSSSENSPFSNILEVEFVIWSTQELIGTEIELAVLDGQNVVSSINQIVDLELGENIIILEIDSLSLSTSYYGGDTFDIDVNVEDSGQQNMFSTSSSVTYTQCSKQSIFMRLNQVASDWSQATAQERGQLFATYLNPLASLWSLSD